MSVDHRTYTNEEIERIGEGIYRREIRSKVMPQQKGMFLIIDIESGDFEVGDDDLQTEKRLCARQPENVFYAKRIGYTSVYKRSGSMVEEPSE